MSTVGSSNMSTLLDTVLNRMTETLDAAGATMYFAEGGGFKLRGVSEGLLRTYVPDFIPYGAGIPTHVLREQRACRLSLVPGAAGDPTSPGSFYDLDARVRHNLRLQDMPPFKTMIAVPVYFGTQVLGVVELGWSRPCSPRVYDVRVLEVICDYLSIELVGVVSSLRAARASGLTRSLSRIRELLYANGNYPVAAWTEMTDEVRGQLSCRLLPVLHDLERGAYVIAREGGGKIDLPRDVEEMFFSVTAPAARVGAPASADLLSEESGPLAVPEKPKQTPALPASTASPGWASGLSVMACRARASSWTWGMIRVKAPSLRTTGRSPPCCPRGASCCCATDRRSPWMTWSSIT